MLVRRGSAPDARPASGPTAAAKQSAMWTWLERRRQRRERARLERLHLALLEQARDLQRGGDMRGFAAKTAEAAEVERRLDALAAARGPAPARDR